MVVPVNKAQEDYAVEVRDRIRKEGFFIDADVSHRTLNKMVRDAQLSQYNYILVVGQQEKDNGTVNIRTRDNVVQGSKAIADLLGEFSKMMDEHTLDVELGVTKAAEK